MYTEEQASTLRALHAEGLWDNEIARRMRISAPTVKRWRKALGLSQNAFDRTSRIWDPVYVDGGRARELYDAGLSDWDIGLELGVDVGQVLRWRRGEGLTPNHPNNLAAGLEDELRVRYEKGLNDYDVANELGISPETVRQWRLREGLRANSHVRIDEKRALEMYQNGASDKAIARALGATSVGVQGWRRRNGLPPNFRHKPVPKDYDWTNVDAQIRDGVPDSEVAQASGLSTYAVAQRRYDLGLKLPRGGKRKLCPDEAAQFHKAGLSDEKIAQKLHVTVGTVRRWRQKMGLAPNQR